MTASRTKILHYAVLLLLVVIVFGNSLANGFVWDDTWYLLNVDAYRKAGFWRFFVTLGNGIEYLPIKDISFALDFAIWGQRATGFHATNLLIYYLNVVAVYLLAERIFSSYRNSGEITRAMPSPATVAFWTSALFALQPIHCEPVNFIAGGRNTLLAALFCFLASRSFIDYLEDNSSVNLKSFVAAIFWFALAVLSKATAVSLPIFFLALCAVARNCSLAKRITSSLPFIALSGVIYFVFTAIAAKTGAVNPFVLSHVPLINRLASAVQIPFFYLAKLFWPFGLSADYGKVFSTWSASVYPVAAAITLVVLTSFVLVRQNREPLVFIAFCWFATTLVPVLQLLPSPMTVADRYAYLPSFAFCFAGAYLMCRYIYIWPRSIIAFGSIVLCIIGVTSFVQNRFWKSDKILWEHTVSISPNSLQALTTLGVHHYVAANYDKAFELLERAQQVSRFDPTYDFFKGHYFYLRGNYPEAVRSFEQALQKQNDQMDALFYLAEIHMRGGNQQLAASLYRRILASVDLDRDGYKKMATERLKAIR